MPNYRCYRPEELLREAHMTPTARLTDPIGVELQRRVEQQAADLAAYRQLQAMVDAHGLDALEAAAALDKLVKHRC
jgi:hypothetical protein